MFQKGTWAVFGIGADAELLEQRLADPSLAFEVSQFRAVLATKTEGAASYGINPFGSPRKDEEFDWSEPLDIGFAYASRTDCYGVGGEFRLDDGKYGFWLCVNDHEDMTDPKSKAEARAYELAGKPFKFLNKDEKRQVEAAVKASAVASRSQFPVLVDLPGGSVYAFTAKEDHIGLVQSVLARLGSEDEVRTWSLAWQFGGYDWPAKFLNEAETANKYRAEMAARADELRRFRPDEVEKLPNKMTEAIVSGYFAMSELPTGQWAGLSTPAKIRLFRFSEPSSEASVSTAFTLMGLTNEAQVASASVTFQQLDTTFTKKGDEKQVRHDLFVVDVNDKCNITDAGCAALRGFDLPQFKREMRRHGKQRGALEVRDYWAEWLIAMKTAVEMLVDNVTETLALDKKEFGMKPYAAREEEEEEEGAGS